MSSSYALLQTVYNLPSRPIHLPDVRCEFCKLNAKYQMHLRIMELAIPSNPPIYPLIDINNDTLSKSLSYFSGYIKSMFTSSHNILDAILITVMYVKIQFRFVLFVFVILARILSTPYVSHKHKPHWQCYCVVHINLF